MLDGRPLYHGGLGGLEVGCILDPPTKTGFLRPQSAMEQAGIKKQNELWLVFKSSYRNDRVYCTTVLDLAMRHAAGVTNWFQATHATERYAEYGAVYQVSPIGTVGVDWGFGLGDEHCCLTDHPLHIPCAYSADRLLITKVIYPVIKSEHAPAMMDVLRSSYSHWKKVSGGVDWWNEHQRQQEHRLSPPCNFPFTIYEKNGVPFITT